MLQFLTDLQPLEVDEFVFHRVLDGLSTAAEPFELPDAVLVRLELLLVVAELLDDVELRRVEVLNFAQWHENRILSGELRQLV
jgi:hypothetical protein